MFALDTERCCGSTRHRPRARWRGWVLGAGLLVGMGSAPAADARGPIAFAPAADARDPIAFAPPVQYAAGDGIRAVAADDFDADGFVDVLVRDPSGRLTIHRGDGRGALVGVLAVRGEAPAAVAHIDGRGALDLVDAAEQDGQVLARVRLSDPSGGFESIVVTPLGPQVRGLRGFLAGEFDGRPGTDLLLLASEEGSSDTAFWVASGTGNGAFAEARRAGSTPGGADAVVLPDLDADGRQDVVTRDADGSLWLSLSDALSPGFAVAEQRRVGPPGSVLGPVAVGRFTAGGPPAIAVADPVRSCIAVVALISRVPSSVPCFPSRGRVQGLTAADFDGDGATEVVHGRSGGGVALLRGRRGMLGAPRTFDIGLASYSSDPLTPDLDGDRRLDLVVVSNQRALVVLRNVGHAQPRLFSSAMD